MECDSTEMVGSPLSSRFYTLYKYVVATSIFCCVASRQKKKKERRPPLLRVAAAALEYVECIASSATSQFLTTLTEMLSAVLFVSPHKLMNWLKIAPFLPAFVGIYLKASNTVKCALLSIGFFLRNRTEVASGFYIQLWLKTASSQVTHRGRTLIGCVRRSKLTLASRHFNSPFRFNVSV